MTDESIRRVVVAGGGTAGWLAACLLAARGRGALAVTLVESPDVPTIGVGEGTWPTMRATLARIGLGEDAFLAAADASFKQGTHFRGWTTGANDDAYDHPFVPPTDGDAASLVAAWAATGNGRAFAELVSAQPHAAGRDLAPRQRAMPDYAGALNYGYHLDAGRFAALLRAHATGRLGVVHLADHVDNVERAADGDVAALRLRAAGRLAGDLFLDCTGHRALLVGDALGVPFVDRGDVLPNDRALAVQVPVAPGSPIASRTVATAHAAGWLWDIGLPTRRGIGCVYSSRHLDDAGAAATLRAHLGRVAPGVDAAALEPRRLAFRSGHRARCWERNVVAVGLAAGFLEPLEASAIVLIELTMTALLDDFPATRADMDALAPAFNRLFRYRWDRIVDFLKLHYLLSRRTEPYWRDARDPATVPASLADLVRRWRHRPPSVRDLPMREEVFPAASYLYVLYGMDFPLPAPGPLGLPAPDHARLAEVARRARALAAGLPTNRAYLDALRAAPAEARA